ncbi:hypothetical protein FWH30_02225, partial [Microgenomates group bacterium]|nr:hypothetical protein [Microgenomates group bacterium]
MSSNFISPFYFNNFSYIYKKIARLAAISLCLFLGTSFFLLGINPSMVSAQTTLGSMSIGQIFQIAPNSGTYMCGASTCTSNGAAAEPYKLMYSGLSDGATRGFIMIDNYCAWRSADCTAYDGTKYWYGTSWNGNGTTNTTGSTTGYHNDLGGSRKSTNILQQLENFYNSLPAAIGGVAKATAIPSRSFDMSTFSFTTGTPIKTCHTTTNSTAYGNIGATFNGVACTMTSRVSLPSYEEWLGGLYGYGYHPPSGTLGYAFCQARYGAVGCNTAGTDLSTGASLAANGLFDTNTTLKRPYYPWLRSPSSGNTESWVFHVQAYSTLSLYNTAAHIGMGVLPWLYIQSSIPISSGAGTYTSPYELGIPNTTPVLSLTNPIASSSLVSPVTIAGTVTDSDTQTLTIRYNVDTTAGNGTSSGGSALTTVAAPATNGNFSANVVMADGSHTVYVWVCDGVECSGVESRSFTVDSCLDPANEDRLMCLEQGDIIQIRPSSGTFMCGAQVCDDDGASAEPYKLMYSGISDGATRGFIMVDNYCAWRSADCALAYDTMNTKYWFGTSWNSNYGDTTISNDLGGSRQSQHILIQLENFYNSLPTTIGGVVKATAIPSRTFNMIGIPLTSGTGAISSGVCQTSTNSTPYGNIGATFVGTIGSSGTCTMTSRVSLPSVEEWLGGLYGSEYHPPSGTLGYAFCQARYNAAGCDAASGTDLNTGTPLSQYDFFGRHYETPKLPWLPWLRSPRADDTTDVFYVFEYNYASLSPSASRNDNGVLPWLYLNSSIEIEAGSGTYADPYCFAGDCNTSPALSLTNPIASSDLSSPATVAGTVTDPDTQTLTIRYNLDTTAGNGTLSGGSVLAIVSAPVINGSFSANVVMADGAHTLYVWACDGMDCSGVEGRSFTISPCADSANTDKLACLNQGDIIQIEPVSGTYMCGAQICTSDGAPAEPYKLMYSGLSDATTRGFIMVDNYCAWRSADCTYYDGTKYWYGTSWNGDGTFSTTGSAIGCHHDLGGSRKSINILQQLENFYNSLPATIGGVAKATAIPTRSFDMSPLPFNPGTSAISKGACNTTTNATAYGNIQATFNGDFCTMTSRVSLPSYEEWLGGLYGHSYYPPSGTLGYAFCLARYGSAGCNATGSTVDGIATTAANKFNQTAYLKRPYHPSLRSPLSGDSAHVFRVYALDMTYSLDRSNSFNYYGVLPWLYIDSSLGIADGSGTYVDPYTLTLANPTLENSTPNIGAYASYVSGFNSLVLAGSAKDEDIGQTLTIQYQIDGTSGTWSNLTTVVADGTNQNWSGVVTLPVGLTDGTHTVYVRVYDGYGYSGNKTASFYLDDIPPANTASLVGGVLCTGIP